MGFRVPGFGFRGLGEGPRRFRVEDWRISGESLDAPVRPEPRASTLHLNKLELEKGLKQCGKKGCKALGSCPFRVWGLGFRV